MRFALPPRFASVVRALGALEGAVLAVDPQFEVVTAAYPHVARALLADRDARARQALRRLVLDRHGRVRWRRLEALGKSAFSDVGSMDSVIVALGGRDAVAGVLTDACDYVCSDAGARREPPSWTTPRHGLPHLDSSNNNVWRVFMDAPELVVPVAARAAASHEARRSLGLLAGRLRARHGARAGSCLEAASRALGEAMMTARRRGVWWVLLGVYCCVWSSESCPSRPSFGGSRAVYRCWGRDWVVVECGTVRGLSWGGKGLLSQSRVFAGARKSPRRLLR